MYELFLTKSLKSLDTRDQNVILQKQMAVSFGNKAKLISDAQLCCAKYLIWTGTV